MHTDVPLQRALIGFELDDQSIAGGWAAVLTPGPHGLTYRPATA
ncbi:hypothetical protein Aab01nite_03490 [Paractinoplanes abujensis]|uniref:Uncharacterized protein n=1 Tax=Paractinoplanes abujensis TaxID=882441 RepID=A0A7W7CR77_9ACTN|nr:hypothetical protein [Actinoplanes abujensis]MBB4691820.1 hypothetical protein [Actinoplanes abujensis]GID16759.1 hypothetical protein Aab01nite_03490 [Actinoplanes abujensis]